MKNVFVMMASIMELIYTLKSLERMVFKNSKMLPGNLKLLEPR